jgi:hypothetical protein
MTPNKYEITVALKCPFCEEAHYTTLIIDNYNMKSVIQEEADSWCDDFRYLITDNIKDNATDKEFYLQLLNVINCGDIGYFYLDYTFNSRIKIEVFYLSEDEQMKIKQYQPIEEILKSEDKSSISKQNEYIEELRSSVVDVLLSHISKVMSGAKHLTDKVSVDGAKIEFIYDKNSKEYKAIMQAKEKGSESIYEKTAGITITTVANRTIKYHCTYLDPITTLYIQSDVFIGLGKEAYNLFLSKDLLINHNIKNHININYELEYVSEGHTQPNSALRISMILKGSEKYDN